ncbi:response regulator [Steroidobacter flavus]|uniref:Response regulator n=1 Tax=Steroidobacter flavus TaxID=1842136 RepID=A0ABV8SN13_9GAMM
MKTVLIVDDSASMRQVCTSALSRGGYNVVEASDGRDGLSKLAAAQKVHLIISDVNMPVMDGLTFAREVKAQPAYKFMPIIMLTTEAGEEKKAQGRAAGVKAWMVKPFQPQVLLDAVAKLVLP